MQKSKEKKVLKAPKMVAKKTVKPVAKIKPVKVKKPSKTKAVTKPAKAIIKPKIQEPIFNQARIVS